MPSLLAQALRSTVAAPWILVEGNDKQYARIKVLESICEALEERGGALESPPSGPAGADSDEPNGLGEGGEES